MFKLSYDSAMAARANPISSYLPLLIKMVAFTKFIFPFKKFGHFSD